MKRTEKNVVIMTTDKGNTVKIVFRKEDNPDIEDIVTDNLLTSYELRIKEQMKISCN
jgi:mevalonate pyrophosphate decarboxylase